MAERLMEELGWQTQLQCPEVPEILSLFCQIPQDLSFAVGAVGFSRLDSGPISLQVQISYHSSHYPHHTADPHWTVMLEISWYFVNLLRLEVIF